MSANYYEILGCKMDDNYEQIKIAYHELIKKHHPDKTKAMTSLEFQQIDQAWKTLRDPKARKLYDDNLKQKQLEEQTLLYGTFSLGELNYDLETQHYSFPCRCGGIYSFTKKHFEEFNSYLVGCEQCSLVISVDLQT